MLDCQVNHEFLCTSVLFFPSGFSHIYRLINCCEETSICLLGFHTSAAATWGAAVNKKDTLTYIMYSEGRHVFCCFFLLGKPTS